jgi:hypothetical protein
VKALLTLAAAVGLAAVACSSAAEPQSSEAFRAEFRADLLDEIAAADLAPDLETLAAATLTTCLDETEPDPSEGIDDFTDCYAEGLCNSTLVAPVWEGDIEACIAEARANFDFGG